MYSLIIIMWLILTPFRVESYAQDVKEETALINVANGNITASFRDIKLEEILKEIERQSGIRVFFEGDSGRKMVSRDINNLPLAEGIERILNGQNFILVYNTDERIEGKKTVGSGLAEIWILSRSEESSQGDRGVSQTPLSLLPEEIEPVHRREDIFQLIHDAINFPDPNIRIQAIRSLGASNNPDARSAIISALTDSDSRVRRTALSVLEDSDDPPPMDIIIQKGLHDADPNVRSMALSIISEMGDEVSVESLKQALHDRDPNVRIAAMEGLLDYGGESAIEFIRTLMNDSNPKVRMVAHELIMEFTEDETEETE
ncbi:MAG: HEAT repeat domain-containing protein [Nitrospirota bacterium]